MDYVTVIGGANIDISGNSAVPIRTKDSNPGKINISQGGVGRNIAENLIRLGVQTEFITLLGDDLYGQEIMQNCQKLGIGMRNSKIVSGKRTSTYLCVNNEKGEMEVAINEMDLYEMMTPEYLEPMLPVINQGKLLIIDANLPSETISFLAKNCKIPILAEPVSTIKAVRLIPILDKLYAVKPNVLELQAMTGIQVTSEETLMKATKELMSKGVKEAYISLGADGVLSVKEEKMQKFSCYPCNMVNTTGCGDAFIAAAAWATIKGMSLEQRTKAGLAASSICIESEGANSPWLKEETLINRMNSN